MSKAEVQRRLDFADKMLRAGKPRAEVVESMAATFNLSTRAADSYIARARDRWAEESAGSREIERAAALARLDRLSGKAETRGAFSAAVSAEKLKAQVNGLLAPQAVEVKATVTQAASRPDDDNMSDQDIVQEMADVAACMAYMLEKRGVEVTPQLVESVTMLVSEVRKLGQQVGVIRTPAMVPALPQ